MKIFRNPEAIWREEVLSKKEASEGLEKGEDVSDIGTSIILSKGMIYALNILGTEVWKLCDGKTLDDILYELNDRFDVDPTVLEKDVESFLSNMKDAGLIYEE